VSLTLSGQTKQPEGSSALGRQCPQPFRRFVAKINRCHLVPSCLLPETALVCRMRDPVIHGSQRRAPSRFWHARPISLIRRSPEPHAHARALWIRSSDWRPGRWPLSGERISGRRRASRRNAQTTVIVVGRTGGRAESPQLLPTRDVDITYDVTLPSQPRVRERVRSAAKVAG